MAPTRRRASNLARVDVELGERFNVIAGDNGQGKTNLLEALYVAATSKSFRSSRIAELIGFGSEIAQQAAAYREDGWYRIPIAAILAHGTKPR